MLAAVLAAGREVVQAAGRMVLAVAVVRMKEANAPNVRAVPSKDAVATFARTWAN